MGGTNETNDAPHARCGFCIANDPTLRCALPDGHDGSHEVTVLPATSESVQRAFDSQRGDSS